MTPCQKLYIQEGTARRGESMQQSSATPPKKEKKKKKEKSTVYTNSDGF